MWREVAHHTSPKKSPIISLSKSLLVLYTHTLWKEPRTSVVHTWSCFLVELQHSRNIFVKNKGYLWIALALLYSHILMHTDARQNSLGLFSYWAEEVYGEIWAYRSDWLAWPGRGRWVFPTFFFFFLGSKRSAVKSLISRKHYHTISHTYCVKHLNWSGDVWITNAQNDKKFGRCISNIVWFNTYCMAYIFY